MRLALFALHEFNSLILWPDSNVIVCRSPIYICISQGLKQTEIPSFNCKDQTCWTNVQANVQTRASIHTEILNDIVLMLTAWVENNRQWNQKRRSSIPRRASWVALEQAADGCNQLKCGKILIYLSDCTALHAWEEEGGQSPGAGVHCTPCSLSISRSPCKPWDML